MDDPNARLVDTSCFLEVLLLFFVVTQSHEINVEKQRGYTRLGLDLCLPAKGRKRPNQTCLLEVPCNL